MTLIPPAPGPTTTTSPAIPASEAADAGAICRDWYQRHGAAVYNYFRFHVPLVEVAEDLTAETFLKLVQSADRFDPEKGSARAWILTIARNALADWRRRARLRQYVPLGTMHDLVCHAPSPEERLLREEAVGAVLNAVSTLPPADRELISLRYGSELDTAEIAQTLGISEGSVRTRLWRVLGRLRGVLRP